MNIKNKKVKHKNTNIINKLMVNLEAERKTRNQSSQDVNFVVLNDSNYNSELYYSKNYFYKNMK